MCICWAFGIGLGAPQEPVDPWLQDDAVPLLELLIPAGWPVRDVAAPLLHEGLGPQGIGCRSPLASPSRELPHQHRRSGCSPEVHQPQAPAGRPQATLARPRRGASGLCSRSSSAARNASPLVAPGMWRRFGSRVGVGLETPCRSTSSRPDRYPRTRGDRPWQSS